MKQMVPSFFYGAKKKLALLKKEMLLLALYIPQIRFKCEGIENSTYPQGG